MKDYLDAVQLYSAIKGANLNSAMKAIHGYLLGR